MNGEDPELTIKKSVVSEYVLKFCTEYEEIDELEEDRYVFCNFCQEFFSDCCTKCGQLAFLQDTVVELGIENRAKLTLPSSSLQIKPSKIHGLGVFSKFLLNKGMKMGPYQGKTNKVESMLGYSWILKNGCLLDDGDERQSNWMRYVNRARNFKEQNLMAFQYKGELYYRICRDIQPGEELLVYYGKNFAMNLGIDVKSYFQPMEDYIVEDGRYCQFCAVGYRDSSRLDKHIILCKSNPANLKKRLEKKFSCQSCAIEIMDEKICERRNRRNKESRQDGGKIERISSKKLFSCSKCEHTSKCASKMKIHERIHEDSPLYVCRLCEKGFQQSNLLQTHMFSHLDDADDIEVIEEQKILDNYGTRTVLMALMKGSQVKVASFDCEKCEFRTARIAHLKRHINEKHTRSAIFQCQVCYYVSPSKNNIKRHQNSVHFKNLTWKCDKCEYKASQKIHLKIHIKRIHDKIKDQKCGICSYKTSRKHELKRHVLGVHLNDKKFKCKFCDFVTISNHHLNIHLNGVHLKNVKFNCPSCAYFSYWKRNLTKHVKTIHQS